MIEASLSRDLWAWGVNNDAVVSLETGHSLRVILHGIVDDQALATVLFVPLGENPTPAARGTMVIEEFREDTVDEVKAAARKFLRGFAAQNLRMTQYIEQYA